MLLRHAKSDWPDVPDQDRPLAVQLARRNGLVVVHDNAYSEICFDGYRAPSFLETPGAKDVGVEIFSPSKGWNMTGWRSGLVTGNGEVVERYRQLKTNLDSGMFEAVQRATVAALTEAQQRRASRIAPLVDVSGLAAGAHLRADAAQLEDTPDFVIEVHGARQ